MIKWDGDLIEMMSDPKNAPGNLYPTGEYIDYTVLPTAQKKTSFKSLAVVGLGILGLVLIMRSK